MYHGNVQALHVQQQLKRKVLHMLEMGSMSLAAMFLWDEYQSMHKVNTFLEDCKDHVQNEYVITELRDLIQEISGDSLWQAAQ